MEFNSLPLVYITAKIKGLVKINENPTGETGKSPVITPYSSKSVFTLTFEPLENKNGKLYLPFTRKIEIINGEITFSEDGFIKHCKWPENTYSFDLYPPYIEYADSSFARVITDFTFYISGVSHKVFVYEEMSYYIGIENSNNNRLVFGNNIDFMVKTAEISLFKHMDEPYLKITGYTKQDDAYIIIVAIKPSFKIIFMKSCVKVLASDESIMLDEKTNISDIVVKKEYIISDNTVRLSGNVIMEKNNEPDNIIANFLEMAKVKKESMMQFLSPSLKGDTSFNDIIEYFGDFSDYDRPISVLGADKNQVALKYNVTENRTLARVFKFDFKKTQDNLLIDNIYEP